MTKTTKKIISASALLLTGMHAFNYFTDICLIPITSTKNDKTFQWKDLKINYTEKGSKDNTVLLLLHNLDPSSSKEEWNRIDDSLADQFHIFEIDLPGCGKSDKPNIMYVNYMYVEIIGNFIKNVIGQKTNICVTGYSSSFILMAARMYPDLINKIIIISPPSIEKLLHPVTAKEKLAEKILIVPIFGTFIYNCIMTKEHISEKYTYEYFYAKENIPANAVDISYYNAHNNHSNGKYLFGSIIKNYTNINIIHALPKITQKIYLISNGSNMNICQEYKKYQKSIQIINVSNCRLLPQLEIPETITEKIRNTILNK